MNAKVIINKKAMVWQQIMLAIIALIVVVLVIFWFKQGGEKAVKGPTSVLDELQADTDNDGVKDYFDKCANTPENTEVDSKGCPENQQPG